MRLPVVIAAAIVATGLVAGPAHAGSGEFAVVSITSVSGLDGHAFVYAQVTDASGNVPAPVGSSYQAPYYSQWRAFPTLSPNCPWVWAVYVYDRATDIQLNAMPPGSPGPNLGTTNLFCPTPTSTPVGVPTLASAQARLSLDLQVALAPETPAAGTPANISAALTGALANDLNLYLSMAIIDWSVQRWVIDFGDGSIRFLRGGSTAITAPHAYAVAGQFQPRVVAFISGHAQAAVFDRNGYPRLIRRSFSVEVGNTILAGVSEPPSRIYFGPRIQARVSPTLEGSGVPAGLAAFDHVEAMRGAMNDFVVRMALLQEGYFAVNGVRAGFGRSFLTGWEFLGPRTGMPATLGTTVGSLHPPTAPLRLEWDAPDRVTLSGRQDYYVSLLIHVRTAYSDGQVRDRAVASTIAVSVSFPAQAG